MNHETPIKKAIIAAINLVGRAVVWNSPAGSALRGRIKLAPGGTPDIVGHMLDGSGRMVAIEVKVPGKKPNADQEAWLERGQRFGVVCGVATNTQEALDIVKNGGTHG